MYRIILYSVYMGPLFARKRQIEFSSCLVRSKVPFSLSFEFRVIRVLLSATDNGPEALGAKESLHLALPGVIVGGGEFGHSGRRVGVFFGHQGDFRAERESREWMG